MTWKRTSFDNGKLHFSNGEVSFIMIKVPDKDFYIGETPVTQQLWENIMGENPSHFEHNPFAPVGNVSHNDCCLFIERLNSMSGESFRLPSDKEWVLAAIGKDSEHPFLYAGSNDPEEVGWFDGHTSPVRLKKPNSIGLFDMTGNVWEWTSAVAPTQYSPLHGGVPKEYIKLPDGTNKIPTFYFLKGGSCMNGHKTSLLTSVSIFGEYNRNWHLGLRLAL